MLNIEIDGKKVKVLEGSTVIEAAKQARIYIPHFCYHKKLTIAANCRMCLVEVEKMPKPMPACATPVTSGMIVKTCSNRAKKAQQSVMEFLLINHPLDCPICDQAGECQLQDLSVGYGISKSRYLEEKRIVSAKNVGPLLSLEEMSRCIHCTRCIRFGQEIAGVMELGMLGRGEHSEISSFIGHTVDSELSGNMIDLCPVGAITSKPFRYSARTWELSRHFSISPHDSCGANLIIQVKNNRVMRVLPFENEKINECWITDKDRFSYEALNSDERLTQPMVNKDGQLHKIEWKIALQYIAKKLNTICMEYGPESIGILVSPHSTIEDLFLAKLIAEAINTPNIDFRLRQTDFTNITCGVPWLGTSIESLENIDSALIIGSDLSQDHPLFAARLRKAMCNGAKISFINSTAYNSLIKDAVTLVGAPSEWFEILATVVNSKAMNLGIALPITLRNACASDIENLAEEIALSLLLGKKTIILLGNGVNRHPDLTAIYALASHLAEKSNATLGFLTEASNSVGAYLVNVLPREGGLNVVEMFRNPRKAYVLLGVEPEFDVANPKQAIDALQRAETVISLSPFKQSMDYIDIMLPVTPFTEMSGSFVNAEGFIQSFNRAVYPLGDARPAWKVLRLIGNLLCFPGFDYETVEEVKKAVFKDIRIEEHLNNMPSSLATFMGTRKLRRPIGSEFERFSDISIYDADPIARRAFSLHATKTSNRAHSVGLPTLLFEHLGLKNGELVRVIQENTQIQIKACHEPELDPNVIRFSAATMHAANMGPLHGELRVEKI